MKSTEYSIVQRLIVASRYKDQDTANHTVRVGQYSHALFHHLSRPCHECSMIYYASQLHDIGKIGVPDAILVKNGPLSQPEIEIMRRHAVIGAEILASNDNHLLKMAAQIARHHHECWNGTGYPDKLAGDEIPLAARVVMIADVYDALRSARPYKLPMSHERALEIIVGGDSRTRPGQFDPQLIDLLHKKGQVLAEIYNNLHGSSDQSGHDSQKLWCFGKKQELKCVVGC